MGFCRIHMLVWCSCVSICICTSGSSRGNGVDECQTPGWMLRQIKYLCVYLECWRKCWQQHFLKKNKICFWLSWRNVAVPLDKYLCCHNDPFLILGCTQVFMVTLIMGLLFLRTRSWVANYGRKQRVTMDHVPSLSRGPAVSPLAHRTAACVGRDGLYNVHCKRGSSPLHPEDVWQGLCCGYCESHWSDKNKLLYFAEAQFSDENICDRFISSHMCRQSHTSYYPNLNSVFGNAHGVLGWWMGTLRGVMADVVIMIVDFKGLVLICSIPHNPSKSMSI